MTRAVTRDFEDLKVFFTEYSLKISLESPEFIGSLKSFHKSYFSFLNLVMHLEHQKCLPNEVCDRLKESCSDIGQALFLMGHGAYKPANLILRSSIENFAKGVGFFEDSEILTMTSLYQVFDIAKKFKGCNLDEFYDVMNNLHTEYGNLCGYTHTATVSQMAHISALSVLPHFDLAKANQLSKIATRVLINYLKIILFSFKIEFFKIDPDNRDIILNTLSPTIKRKIYEST